MSKTKEKTSQTEAKRVSCSTSVLQKCGLAALKKHNLEKAYVCTDGQVFRNESDAKNHAFNLTNKEIIIVEGQNE